MRVATLAFAVLIVTVCCVVPVFAQTAGIEEETTGTAITKEAVWSADRQTVQTARQRCAELSGKQVEECFADVMASFGASPEAVSFTRSFGAGAFIRKFRETGRVDVAYIVYPFRANENYGVLLLNGEPSVVDVDDIGQLPKEGMEQDKTYIAIKKSYPRVTLWPGDRSPKQYPTVETSPDGGETFTVPYTLRNFCHACEVLGTVYFAFDFDKEGKLIAIRFLRLELPPKKVPKSDSRKDIEQVRFVVMTEEGKEFTVRLNSNRTTGYQWRPAGQIDERIVKLLRSEYVTYEGGPVGSGGEEIWTFLATGRGDTEITMEYVRPWEKIPHPVKTATIKVFVRPASR
jgi:predicted secreted protein